jgi:hypothetical protein
VVIDQQIDGTQFGRDPRKSPFDGVIVDNVCGHSDRSPTLTLNQRDGFLDFRLCARKNSNFGALPRLLEGDLPANSPAATGNNRYSVRKPSHLTPLESQKIFVVLANTM